jgi:hypothetical protein
MGVSLVPPEKRTKDEENGDTTLNTYDANLLPKSTAVISRRENRHSHSRRPNGTPPKRHS